MDKKQKTPDVNVVLTREGAIVNGNNDVLAGMVSELGKGTLGRMQLGE